MVKGLRPEKTRADRIHNIAAVISAYAASSEKDQYLNTSRVRREIRSALKLPELSGEEFLKDIRQHGDCIAGHGLGLQMVRISGKRYVKLSPETYERCKAVLVLENKPTVYLD